MPQFHTADPALIEQIAWLIPRLPEPSPFQIRCEADYYGAAHEIARAIGLPSPPHSSATWKHGWNRFPSDNAAQCATYQPGTRVHLMPDEHHQRLLRDAGYPNALAVGYPFLYTPSSGHARRPRSLLIAPFHLLPEITPAATQCENEQLFAAYAVAQRDHFDCVCACLHASCAETGLWTASLEAAGIPWILGAMTADANSQRRVRTLFESFDCVLTNHIGSVIPYAAYCGARACVAGPAAAMPDAAAFAANPAYQKHPEALERLQRLLRIPLTEDLPFLVKEPSDAICPQEWANETLGAKHQASPAEIARLLGWRINQIPAGSGENDSGNDSHRKLLITLGWSPPALGEPEDQLRLAKLLEKNNSAADNPVTALETTLDEVKALRQQAKDLKKQAADGAKFQAVQRSWTWRLLAKPLFSIEKRLRPSQQPPKKQ